MQNRSSYLWTCVQWGHCILCKCTQSWGKLIFSFFSTTVRPGKGCRSLKCICQWVVDVISYTYAERGFQFLQEYELTPMMSHDPTALKEFCGRYLCGNFMVYYIIYTIEMYRIDVNRAAPVSTAVLMSVAQRDLRNLILLFLATLLV